MNILYLSPHFPPNFTPFCLNLHRCGAKVYAIGDGDFNSFPVELREAISEYYWVSSLEDWNQSLAGARYFRDKHGAIDRVVSLQEHWISLEAAIRDEFDIQGPRSKDTNLFRHKSLMKEKFREAGLQVARGEVIDDFEHAKQLLNDFGRPLIIKPDIGVGASSTFKIKDEAQLSIFFTQAGRRSFIAEEFVEGDLVSIDGLTDKNGQIIFSTSMAFPLQIMDVVNRDLDLYYYTLRQVPHDLLEAAKKIVAAFGVHTQFFHFEFFRNQDSQALTALEVNMRPPGLLTTDMWNFSFDIDIYSKWANVVAHNYWDPIAPAKYHVCYVSRKYNHSYQHSQPEIEHFCGPHLVHWEEVPSVFRQVGGDAAYLVRAEELEQVLVCASFIQQKK